MHRPRQHSADDPVACFVTALHTLALANHIHEGHFVPHVTPDGSYIDAI